MSYSDVDEIINSCIGDMEIPSGDDVSYPGEYEKNIADSLNELTKAMKLLQSQLDQTSKSGQRQFYITVVISLLALIAAAVAAAAAVIPLLRN